MESMGSVFTEIINFLSDAKIFGVSLVIWALIPLVLSIVRLFVRGNKQ